MADLDRGEGVEGTEGLRVAVGTKPRQSVQSYLQDRIGAALVRAAKLKQQAWYNGYTMDPEPYQGRMSEGARAANEYERRAGWLRVEVYTVASEDGKDTYRLEVRKHTRRGGYEYFPGSCRFIKCCCEAAKNNKPCKHGALVGMALEEERHKVAEFVHDADEIIASIEGLPVRPDKKKDLKDGKAVIFACRRK